MNVPFHCYGVGALVCILCSPYDAKSMAKASILRFKRVMRRGNTFTLRWRHNELDGVSDHQPHDCLLNRLFGSRSKKTSKLRVTGLYSENSPGTDEFPAQMTSNLGNVSIWWRHHDCYCQTLISSVVRATDNVMKFHNNEMESIHWC